MKNSLTENLLRNFIRGVILESGPDPEPVQLKKNSKGDLEKSTGDTSKTDEKKNTNKNALGFEQKDNFLIKLSIMMHDNRNTQTKGFNDLYANISENIVDSGILKLLEYAINKATALSILSPKESTVGDIDENIKKFAAFCSMMQSAWDNQPDYSTTVRQFEEILKVISDLEIKKIINKQEMNDYNWQSALFCTQEILNDKTYNNSIWHKDPKQFNENFKNLQASLMHSFLNSDEISYVVLPNKSGEMKILVHMPNRIPSLLGKNLDGAFDNLVDKIRMLYRGGTADGDNKKGYRNVKPDVLNALKKIDSAVNKTDQEDWFDILTTDEGRYGRAIATATDIITFFSPGGFLETAAKEGVKSAVKEKIIKYGQKYLKKRKNLDTSAEQIMTHALENSGDIQQVLNALNNKQKKDVMSKSMQELRQLAKQKGIQNIENLGFEELIDLLRVWSDDEKFSDMKDKVIKQKELQANKNQQNTTLSKNNTNNGELQLNSKIYSLSGHKKILKEIAPAVAAAWGVLETVNIAAHALDDFLTVPNSNYFEMHGYYEFSVSSFIGGDNLVEFHKKVDNYYEL